jgi:hypothetical protein
VYNGRVTVVGRRQSGLSLEPSVAAAPWGPHRGLALGGDGSA